MALPHIQSLEDCADFTKSVMPWLLHPRDFMHHSLESIRFISSHSLSRLYVDTNPLVSASLLSLFIGLVCFIVSESNKNCSQIDRLWSMLPTLYTAHFSVWARAAGLPHSRVDLLLAVSAIWTARLTFNYWRRGGYTVGSEDYRWVIVKGWFPAGTFALFNFVFISMYQSILLFLVAGPSTYVILLANQLQDKISAADVFYATMIVALVVSEWIFDGQQWYYQNAKSQYRVDAKVPAGFKQADLDRGFVTSGAWAYSRHPNFAAEQMVWLAVYLWGCYASSAVYSWTFVGTGLYMLIFQGSTILTESITSSKYHEYAEYQKRVGKFIPTSLKAYNGPAPRIPKIIRTSQLAALSKQKQK